LRRRDSEADRTRLDEWPEALDECQLGLARLTPPAIRLSLHVGVDDHFMVSTGAQPMLFH